MTFCIYKTAQTVSRSGLRLLQRLCLPNLMATRLDELSARDDIKLVYDFSSDLEGIVAYFAPLISGYTLSNYTTGNISQTAVRLPLKISNSDL